MTFPHRLKLQPRNAVIFCWVIFKWRQHRDPVNAKDHERPRISSMDPEALPHDSKQMLDGGLKLRMSG